MVGCLAASNFFGNPSIKIPPFYYYYSCVLLTKFFSDLTNFHFGVREDFVNEVTRLQNYTVASKSIAHIHILTLFTTLTLVEAALK